MGSLRIRLRPIAATTAVAMLMTGTGLPPATLAQSPSPGPLVATSPGLELPADSELAGDAALVVPVMPDAPEAIDAETVIDDALATADALPDTEWEVAALATTLGDDPAAAFRTLRDRIRFEPYPGALRGAEGTLAARAGNAWDRALLLKGLLDAMGATTRFAFGDLDDATAQELVSHTLDAAPDPLPEAGALAATTFALEAIATRARRDNGRLRTALDAAGVTLGGASEADLVAEVRPHVWVQVERDGTWLDLDPSLPQAEAGQRLTEPTHTADALPADAWQGVTIQVVTEHLSDGALSAETVLERRLPAPDAAAAEVFLYFVPHTTGGGLLAGPSVDGYVPQLMIDREVQEGASFSVSTDGGDGDFFGLGGGGAPALTGVWLRVIREAPGREPVETRIPFLDRVPEGARASGSVAVEDLEPLPTSEAGPTALAAIRHLVVSTGGASAREAAIERGAAMAFVGTDLLDETAAAGFALGDVLWPVAVADQAVALASERLIVPALAEPGIVAPVIDRPRLSLFSFGPDPHDPARLQTSIDLAADEVRLVAREDADAVDLAHRQVWHGVLESALETEAMLQSARWAAADERAVAGASLSMDQPQLVLSDAAALPPGAVPALARAIEAGDVAVVPGDPATAHTWWTVDPTDGVTRAIVDPGLGGAVATRSQRVSDTHDIQGGWTPGGGSYVNEVSNGVRYIVNPETGAPEGFIRDGRTYRYTRNAPRARTCSGGNEYSNLLGCVSIPMAFVIGGVTGVIVVWAVSRSIRALR